MTFQTVVNWIAVIWVAIQSGLLVQMQFSLEQNILFWPLWISWVVVIFLVVKIIDLKQAKSS